MGAMLQGGQMQVWGLRGGAMAREVRKEGWACRPWRDLGAELGANKHEDGTGNKKVSDGTTG